MSADGPPSATTPAQPMIDVQIRDSPVEYEPFAAFPQPAGAEAVFLGRTRDEAHPTFGRLKRLSYEAYRPMAERVLRQLADEAIDRYGCLSVRVHHAVGDVGQGEASVLVQVVCPHRDAAFDACRFLIDALKEQAPIWKQEHWAGGETWSEGRSVRSSASSVEPAT